MSMDVRSYNAPLGAILLAADERGLAGLWFEGQKHVGEFGSTRNALSAGMREPGTVCGMDGAEPFASEASRRVLLAACAWLDSYFAAAPLPSSPALHLMGTPFQLRVWQLLLEIPCGRTTTYGALAREYERRFDAHTSARAVGGAVGRNPISIIVPCHRVVGADGAITGYAGGVDRKRALLALEGAGRQTYHP